MSRESCSTTTSRPATMSTPSCAPRTATTTGSTSYVSTTSRPSIIGELRLVPGTIAIFDAELAGDHVTLAALLEVTKIDEWPPVGSEHDAGAVTFFRDAHL